MEASIFQFLRETLLLRFPENIDEADRAEHLRFVMKFQQCTGPITAKGIEDTTFYIYNRLAALNEVGGEPDHFGGSPEVLHKQNGARLAEFPHCDAGDLHARHQAQRGCAGAAGGDLGNTGYLEPGRAPVPDGEPQA